MLTCFNYYDNRVKTYQTIEELAAFLCIDIAQFMRILSSPFPCTHNGWIIINNATGTTDYDTIKNMYARYRGLIYYYLQDVVHIAPTPEILADSTFVPATLAEIKHHLKTKDYMLNGGLLHYGGDRANSLRLLRKHIFKGRQNGTIFYGDQGETIGSWAIDLQVYKQNNPLPPPKVNNRVHINHDVTCIVCGYPVVEMNHLDILQPSDIPIEYILYCSNKRCINHTGESIDTAMRSWAIRSTLAPIKE